MEKRDMKLFPREAREERGRQVINLTALLRKSIGYAVLFKSTYSL
ncbi:MAG: hypothetical protein VB140_03970 [Burkholderia sp.]